MRYRKKPVVIDAIQWTGDADSWNEVCSFIGVPEGGYGLVGGDKPEGVRDEQMPVAIKTLEGTMIATVGDWIIRGIKGELYPCKPDIFEATYELVKHG